MKKKRIMKINETKLQEQLNTVDMNNWLVIEGVKRHREGKPIGMNLTTFLEIIGVMETEN